MLSYSLSQFIIKTKITTTKIYFQKNVNINNMDILYYDRIEISEEIDINKTSAMSVIFVTIGISQIKDLRFNQMSAMGAKMY